MARAFRIVAAVIALIGFGWSQALAAVVLGSCGAENRSIVGTSFFDYSGQTVGASDTGLVAEVLVVNGGPLVAPTANWDSVGTPQPMTLLGSANNGAGAAIFFYGLRNPTVGNKNLHIAWTTNTAQVMVVTCSWQGLDTTSDATAFKNFNSATGSNTTTQAVTITSTANDAVMAAHTGVTTSYGSVNNTSLFIDNAGSTFAGAGNEVVGSVNPSMTASFTGTFTTVSAGISIAATATTTCPRTRAATGAGC